MPYLKLLGGAVLGDDHGGTIAITSRRHPIALLALLALAPSRTLSRSKLAGYLWPDSPEKTARNRLNTYLHQVRSHLGEEALISAGADVRLGDAVRCDVCEYREALDEGEHERAAALYAGAFMDGFRIGGSPEFEQWVDRQEATLRRDYLDALTALAEEAEAQGEPEVAVRWWQERVREDPYDSGTTARLMESLAAAGNRAAAIRTAKAHAELLDREFGTAPGPEVRAALGGLSAVNGGPTPAVEPARPAPAELDPRAIAVLPFEELGGGEEASVFAHGLHHDLLTRLSRIGALTVISRTSVLRYQGSRTPIPEIARALGVGTIMEGGVQQSGSRVRLNVQLIDARSDGHRWAQTYDRRLTAENLFDIQSELAERIAESLHATLSPEERERAVRWIPTDDLEAYRLCAHGREEMDARTEEGIREGLDHFEQATQRDPNYTLAWVGLADALILLLEYGFADAGSTLGRAEEAVQRALELDPSSGEAHASRGLLHEARQDGPGAIRELKRAIELQPSYAEAHNWLSWTSQLLGRAEDARRASERAVALNPLSPEAVANLAATNMMTGRGEIALKEARRVRAMLPHEDTAAFYEGIILHHLGRPEEAVEVLRGRSVPWAGSGPLAALALAHVAAGDETSAREILLKLEGADEHFSAGLVRAALGNVEDAFDAFERVDRWSYWPTLAVHHYYPVVWDRLRGDARYEEIVRTVKRSWGV
jgi:DNA-binding SARP family transcriptional activator/TolB-like protein/Flp pilus assembly protein TadD